jgi:hypothetical protein
MNEGFVEKVVVIMSGPMSGQVLTDALVDLDNFYETVHFG